uniref:Uncharacterized protein n=1 Tax=Romanomermis culicivorax TaxID=13658 RepID=A0A915K2A2_ROMCU
MCSKCAEVCENVRGKEWLCNRASQKMRNKISSPEIYLKKIEAVSLMLPDICRLSDSDLCYKLCEGALELEAPRFTPRDGISFGKHQA